ncbi:MAG: hypothetical protein ACRDSR_24540 [Pseudonocardiaceae bacterium]
MTLAESSAGPHHTEDTAEQALRMSVLQPTVWTISRQNGTIYSVAFSPDKHTVATRIYRPVAAGSARHHERVARWGVGSVELTAVASPRFAPGSGYRLRVHTSELRIETGSRELQRLRIVRTRLVDTPH